MEMWFMSLKTQHGILYSVELGRIPRKKKKQLKNSLISEFNNMTKEEFVESTGEQSNKNK